MAGPRFSLLKSFSRCLNPTTKVQSCDSYMKLTRCANESQVRLYYVLANNNYNQSGLDVPTNSVNKQLRALGSVAHVGSQYYKMRSIPSLLSGSKSLFTRSTIPIVSMSPHLNQRSYSWSSGNKDDKPGDVEALAASSGSEVDASNGSIVGSDLIDKVKDAWQSAVDAGVYSGEKVKEASDQLIPLVQQLLDMHPYLNNVIFPASCYLTGTVLAWMVMPKVLRQFHKYAMQGPTALLYGSGTPAQVPYEKSFWGALEDPVRYLITFMAFLNIGMMVAPTTIAAQYFAPACRGAVILSIVWFLHRCKTNVFARAMTSKSLAGLDRQRMLALDKVSSVGLFVIGLMTLAEASGVAVHSILTVGGIGGVATAFASKDILGNVLSGLSLQFSQPFSVGDNIKAGSVEGQVVEMGFTTTSLLNAEKFPVIVPNSLFSNQVIVNKSQAQWRAMTTKIPVQVDDFDKIPQISNDIKSMLKSNAKVFLGMEAPYCFLSHVESSFAELTLGCNLKYVSKEELYTDQQEVLLQAVRVIKEHGASLGSTYKYLIS